MSNPCYKCDDRSAMCHAECERYKKWLVDYRADKSKKLKAEFAQYEQDRYVRLTRRRKKRFEGGHQ